MGKKIHHSYLGYQQPLPLATIQQWHAVAYYQHKTIGMGVFYFRITLSDNENACQKLDATCTAARRSHTAHAVAPTVALRRTRPLSASYFKKRTAERKKEENSMYCNLRETLVACITR